MENNEKYYVVQLMPNSQEYWTMYSHFLAAITLTSYDWKLKIMRIVNYF